MELVVLEKGEDSFVVQLDEVSVQLDELVSNFDELKSVMLSFFVEDVVVVFVLDGDVDDDFDFFFGVDEVVIKLDLVCVYIDMGDSEGVCDIFDEVLVEGNDSQQVEVCELLECLV